MEIKEKRENNEEKKKDRQRQTGGSLATRATAEDSVW
jgi:hypothetical protein